MKSNKKPKHIGNLSNIYHGAFFKKIVHLRLKHPQQTNTFSKLMMKTLENSEICSKLTIKTT